MDIHHIHKWWTPIIFVFIGHPPYSLISTIYDVYQTWQTSIKYDGHYSNMMRNHKWLIQIQVHTPFCLDLHWPASHYRSINLIIIMELHQWWLSNNLLFLFQIKVYNCKMVTSHAKMELLEPSGKVWYRPYWYTGYFQENPIEGDQSSLESNSEDILCKILFNPARLSGSLIM